MAVDRPDGGPLAEQVGIILGGLAGAASHPAGRLAETEYLYRDGRILVRDVDLPRVTALVAGAVADPLVNGVTALELADTDVLTALDRIDAALGVGVATPDHVFWVAPARCCPATEPDPVTEQECSSRSSTPASSPTWSIPDIPGCTG